MDTSLIINATQGNKKISKAISNINPENDNDILKTFAQMVNGLTTGTYVDATRITKESVEEQHRAAGASKIEPVLTFGEVGVPTLPAEILFEYNGDGMIFARSDDDSYRGAVSIESSVNVLHVAQPCNVTLYAAEGEHYAAKFATYTVEVE